MITILFSSTKAGFISDSIVLNKSDKHVADEVVNLDELKGIWCYVVMPKMRNYENMSKKLQKRIMKAFPKMQSRNYKESFEDLRNKLKEMSLKK